MLRKLSYYFVAGATAFSMSAYAGGQHSQQQSRDQGSASQGAGSDSTTAQPQAQAGQNSGGQSPEMVKQAQEKLSAEGHDAGPSDGKMGPKTQAALKEFQESKGLEASGRLDQETIAALGVSEPGSASSGSSAPQSPDSRS